MPRLPLLVLGLGGVLVLSGCQALGGCSNPDKYAGAENLPRLKIPVGLDGPDTAQALELPDLAGTAAAPAEDSKSCLEEPPPMREPGSNSEPVRPAPASETDSARKRNRPVSPPR